MMHARTNRDGKVLMERDQPIALRRLVKERALNCNGRITQCVCLHEARPHPRGKEAVTGKATGNCLRDAHTTRQPPLCLGWCRGKASECRTELERMPRPFGNGRRPSAAG